MLYNLRFRVNSVNMKWPWLVKKLGFKVDNLVTSKLRYQNVGFLKSCTFEKLFYWELGICVTDPCRIKPEFAQIYIFLSTIISQISVMFHKFRFALTGLVTPIFYFSSFVCVHGGVYTYIHNTNKLHITFYFYLSFPGISTTIVHML